MPYANDLSSYRLDVVVRVQPVSSEYIQYLTQSSLKSLKNLAAR
jgi:hypothetical protein